MCNISILYNAVDIEKSVANTRTTKCCQCYQGVVCEECEQMAEVNEILQSRVTRGENGNVT